MSGDFKDLFKDWTPSNSSEDNPEPENRRPRILHEKEVKVVNVFEASYDTPHNLLPAPHSFFVLLRDNRGREIRIFILREIALSIHIGLSGEKPDRPFTHDLMKTMLEHVGAKVERVIIDDLWDDTFYSKINLIYGRNHEQSVEIDARSSDAIAIALRFRAPIYVAEDVFTATQPPEN